MEPLTLAVLTASLIGSPHCVGMCGPFALLVGHSKEQPSHSAWRSLVAYHSGRLVGYATLGAIAAAVGAALDLGGTLIGIQRVAAIAAGGLMVVFGVLALLQLRGAGSLHFRAPKWLEKFLARAHRLAASLPPTKRGATVGLLTVLLPCGWLYAFVITAAGTANVLHGALLMAVFWIGTVPALSVVAMGVNRVSERFRRYVPLATAMLLIVVGSYTMGIRAYANYEELAPPVNDATPQQMRARVEQLPHQPMPCCRDE